MPRVTISEPDKTPQPYRFKLERTTVNIGRGSENDIIIQCGSVSTNHAIMERVEGGYILRDIGSTNGIKKNDAQMDVIDLFDGMEVQVGDIPLKFELGEEEIEVLSEEEFISHQKKKLPKTKEKQDPPPAKPKASDSPRPVASPTPMASATPGMNPLLVMILMVAALLGGMAIRHYQDHNKMIFSESTKTAKKKDSKQPEEKPEAVDDTTSTE